MEKRYKGTSYNYATSYLVECPKCKKEAEVIYPQKYCPEFRCNNCMSKANREDYRYYKATVKRNCPNCGKSILTEINNLKEPPKEMTVTCTECKFSAQYIPVVTNYILHPNLHGLKGDPEFGFPLWLQTEVKDNLFWAYNREHLVAIEAYIEADLRERQTSCNQKMLNKLPLFIKDAKNREDILKAISRLQKK